ncbi:GntR family transcriptional regulator [Frigidibacter albus]
MTPVADSVRGNMPRIDPRSDLIKAASQRAEPATLTALTRIRELIVTGQIRAGARLTAETIAKELGISRTPVRSALAVLTAEGLVSYSVNRGYMVRDISLRDILDAIDARAVLESRASGLSVDYGWTADELDRLEVTVQVGANIIGAGAWSEDVERRWYEANRGFHSLIVAVSRNAAIRNAIRMTLIYPVFGDMARLCPVVAAHVPPRHRVVPPHPPKHVVESQADHEAILDAIAVDDAPLVERLMPSHVMKSKDRLGALAVRR